MKTPGLRFGLKMAAMCLLCFLFLTLSRVAWFLRVRPAAIQLAFAGLLAIVAIVSVRERMSKEVHHA